MQTHCFFAGTSLVNSSWHEVTLLKSSFGTVELPKVTDPPVVEVGV